MRQDIGASSGENIDMGKAAARASAKSGCFIDAGRLCAALLIPALLTACGPEGPSKADTGMIVGGVAGGIIGNQVGKGTGNVLATVAGAMVGGIVGSEIGRSMDEQDRRLAEQA